jgi:hypothetical protein
MTAGAVRFAVAVFSGVRKELRRLQTAYLLAKSMKFSEILRLEYI